MVSFVSSRVKGSPLKFDLGSLRLLPKQKSNILLVFGECGVACLLGFCHEGEISFTTFPKYKETSLDPSGSRGLSIAEQQVSDANSPGACLPALRWLRTASASGGTSPGWDHWAAVNEFTEPDGSHHGRDSEKNIAE